MRTSEFLIAVVVGAYTYTYWGGSKANSSRTILHVVVVAITIVLKSCVSCFCAPQMSKVAELQAWRIGGFGRYCAQLAAAVTIQALRNTVGPAGGR